MPQEQHEMDSSGVYPSPTEQMINEPANEENSQETGNQQKLRSVCTYRHKVIKLKPYSA